MTLPSTFAGLAPHADGRPWVMGIVNVTPDSFSDGGLHLDAGRAVAAGLRLREDGADIVDVGGESTRPGAAAVTVAEEAARVVPVVRGLVAAGAVVSIDTRRADVMRAALDAGARIVNDVSALGDDQQSLELIATRRCPVILMYRRGTAAGGYEAAAGGDIVAAARTFLAARVQACRDAGVPQDAIAIDPGVGFVGASPDDNLPLIARLAELATLGRPIVVGASRKRFVGAISEEPVAARRLGGSLALALAAAARGAAILRVHDVRETVQALKAQAALARIERTGGEAR
ncbi:dihydropteroate synthase [Vineibacter terrae]|uniref:dihydropteroate synthase n=1 Tax=Vineibacter terrae TaxID=2586908 RepID=UPI002E2EF8C2|nr:dihydropteroate synthase [Vineibacter terrae]HEX2892063.1 dihydropteroate synthase [Vineibacter terrae]